MRVLVVEDESDLRTAIVRALEETNYAVDQAADGNDGLYKASIWDYDAVILDIMLPKMDGWEVLGQLRSRKKKTPVLILTARDSVSDRVRGLDAGGDDYLVKPFSLSELQARVRALIRRAAGVSSTLLEIGDIHLDTAAKSVTVKGELIPLTAREYALVEFLALRRGRVVTRSMLYDHIFDENDDSLSNLLEVHISNIRKKLGKDFISTRRGMGYMIDV